MWTGAEILAPTGIRFPDRPARSELLYRLSHPGPMVTLNRKDKGQNNTHWYSENPCAVNEVPMHKLWVCSECAQNRRTLVLLRKNISLPLR
jgi:hypothetical protein